MATTIVFVSPKGEELANVIAQELTFSAKIISSKEFSALAIDDFQESSSTYHNEKNIIFIGAMGICVRTIAPLVHDKHTDPAVVCVDSCGKYAISVLSGHIGGANELTRKVARIIGAEPILTTQSDLSGQLPLDTLASENGWQEETIACSMNEIIAHYVNGKSIKVVVDKHIDTNVFDNVTSIQNAEFCVALTPRLMSDKGLYYRPSVLHLGIGCAHDCPVGDRPEKIIATVRAAGYSELSIASIDTIDAKANEPLIAALLQRLPWAKLCLHTASQLSLIPVPNPSEYAQKYVGTPSVCEASVLTYGELLIEKVKAADYTIALSIDESCDSVQDSHHPIEIVGAGPGDPELVSVRGRRLLEQADLILYAGSLVPERLTHYAKVGCVVRNSAPMNLEEQYSLMHDFWQRGLRVVRLHTGDPCIYGAIQEQMALFDQAGMSYRITPGISAFQAAAAALNSQFTIPEEVQTIILTRGEGRTPMPEREQLHRLAQSRSTMCIYLSAAISEEVQKELLTAYPPETPVAACYKLTWPEQRIYRGVLKDLSKIVRENNLTLTTLLVVGDAIDNRHGLSRLYADEFKHLFRK